LTFLEIILITLVLSIGAALQGSVGFGMALAVTPLLVLINPEFVPGPMLVSAFLLSILMVFRERRSVSLQGVQWAIFGRLCGAVISAGLLIMIDPNSLVTIFGVLVLVAVLITASGYKVALTKVNLAVAGTIAGIMGTLASIGGPPMALIYQNESGSRIRTTLSGFFIAGTLISITTLLVIGRFGVSELYLAGIMLPGIILGFLLSSRALLWFDGKYTRSIILIISSLSAIILIARQFV